MLLHLPWHAMVGNSSAGFAAAERPRTSSKSTQNA